jgi:AcrR family transcriptional regulator
MSTEKIDRRVLRTRRSLRSALMSLILEKGFDSVTIEDITNRADVGRTTFYLHYHDKEELLLECINDAIDDLIAQVSNIPLSAWRMPESETKEQISPTNVILQIFQHACDHPRLYRIILRGEGTKGTQNRLREIIAEAVDNFLSTKVENDETIIKPKVPLEVFSNYFAGSLLGIMTWWLEADMPYSPEQMSQMFQMLFFPGAGDVLGISFP